MNIDDALPIFFAESYELLQEMEDGLLRVESEADPAPTINAIFRAAHTVKGSSGLFGINEIVEFTHSMESLLDRARDGQLQIEGPLVQLLLSCTDHIRLMIDLFANGQSLDEAARETGQKLAGQVQAYLGTEGCKNVSSAIVSATEA